MEPNTQTFLNRLASFALEGETHDNQPYRMDAVDNQASLTWAVETARDLIAAQGES